jgi:hypothetical protein
MPGALEQNPAARRQLAPAVLGVMIIIGKSHPATVTAEASRNTRPVAKPRARILVSVTPDAPSMKIPTPLVSRDFGSPGVPGPSKVAPRPSIVTKLARTTNRTASCALGSKERSFVTIISCAGAAVANRAKPTNDAIRNQERHESLVKSTARCNTVARSVKAEGPNFFIRLHSQVGVSISGYDIDGI